MARSLVYTDARFPNGDVAVGSTVSIYSDSAGTTLATIYAADSGSTTLTNPVTVDAEGYVSFWTTLSTVYFKSDGDTTVHPFPVGGGPGGGGVNVLDYGAAGDGVTDDTAAIQAAIDEVFSLYGGTVFVPVGEYKITSPLVLRAYVHLYGDGQMATIIHQATAGEDVVQAYADGDGLFAYAELSHMRLQGSQNAAGDEMHGCGFSYNSAYGGQFFYMHDVDIRGCGSHGVSITPQSTTYIFQFSRFERVRVHSFCWELSDTIYVPFRCNGAGFNISGNVNSVTFADCAVYATLSHGISITQGYGSGMAQQLLFLNPQLEGCGRNVDAVCHGMCVLGCNGLVVRDGYTEDNGAADTSHKSSGINIGGDLDTAVYGLNTSGVLIEGVKFGYFWRGIWVEYATNVTIGPCQFDWIPSTWPGAVGIYLHDQCPSGIFLHKQATGTAGYNEYLMLLSDTGSRSIGWNSSRDNPLPSVSRAHFSATSMSVSGRIQGYAASIPGNAYSPWTAASDTNYLGNTTYTVSGQYLTATLKLDDADEARVNIGFMLENAGEIVYVAVVSAHPSFTVYRGWMRTPIVAHDAGASWAKWEGDYIAGSVLWNSAPASGQPIGWICTNASPAGMGTWLPMANL